MNDSIDTEKLKQHPWYELVHESNTIEGFPDSPDMDLASLRALEALAILDIEVGLNHMIIKQIQKEVTAPQWKLPEKYKGTYRSETNTEAYVGDKQVPESWKVDALMDAWLENFDSRDPRQNHIEFERIHPFADGNGRTGRILMWWQEMAQGGEATIIKSDSDSLSQYYKWFDD